MGFCGNAWERVSVLVGDVGSKVQSIVIKSKAKCPKCSHEFDIEVKVDQKVTGAVLDFNASPGSGLSGLCPWTQVKK